MKKVLIVGRMDGWMAVHLAQLARGFEQAGAESRTFNYRERGLRMGLMRAFSREKELLLRTERTKRVLGAIRSFSPDIVLVNGGRLDLPRIRAGMKGTLVFWDMDGPEGELVNEGFPWENGVDLVLTVSRPLERRFSSPHGVPVRYLPHGTDLDFYAPGSVSREQHERFAAPLAFVGRVCERREKLLEGLVDLGLVVWGSAWSNKTISRSLKGCVREGKDAIGPDLLALYRSSAVVLNILRDPFVSPPSILSLQAFSIPSTGACMLTDWVEELEDAYDPDREVISFRSTDELVEKARRYSTDREAARRVAAAGRRRCEADHSLGKRAQSILDLVDAVR
jgi:glycosyltransferase involved in cell wall biosynthesis